MRPVIRGVVCWFVRYADVLVARIVVPVIAVV